MKASHGERGVAWGREWGQRGRVCVCVCVCMFTWEPRLGLFPLPFSVSLCPWPLPLQHHSPPSLPPSLLTVALDYNAAFTAACAALRHLHLTGQMPA